MYGLWELHLVELFPKRNKTKGAFKIRSFTLITVNRNFSSVSATFLLQ